MTPHQLEERLALFSPDPSTLLLSIPKEQKWMAVSQLQKAIRRGLPDQAATWAHALWNADRSYGLFRMAVIAAEEIGGANPALAARYLESEIRRAWFDERGGSKALVFFAREFALSPKDRSSCDLAGLAKRASVAPANLRGEWADAAPFANDMPSLESLALDDALDPRARQTALWMLAGTTRIPVSADMIPATEGDQSLFFSVCQRLCEDEDLKTVIRKSMSLNKEPNPIGLALCRRLALAEGPFISPEPFEAATQTLGNWTLAGIDMHTREGKAAIAQWLKHSKPLQRLMAPISSWSDKLNLLGYLVFRLEGHEVSPKMSYPTAHAIQLWCRQGLCDAIGRPDPEPVFRGLNMLLPSLMEHRKIACGLIEASDPSPSVGDATGASSGSGGFKGSFKTQR